MKYPRTYHLPWSEGATNDDKRAKSVETLLNRRIVITEKMDGSNVCMTREGCFSRSHAGPPTHASFDAFKALHSEKKFIITPREEIFGEWCYALHSVSYSELPGYFMLFGIRANDAWYSWDITQLNAEELEVPTVPVLFDGMVTTERELQKITNTLAEQPSACGGEREGVVVRIYSDFPDSDFSKNVMKWVRKDHVQTDEHWKNQTIVRNKLA